MTEFQIVPPPADGLADAFRSAASRRRRSAATAGSASVLSAALVFAALTGSTGQVLTQEPAPPADAPSLVELVPGPDTNATTEPLEPPTPTDVVLAAGPDQPAGVGAPFRVTSSAATRPKRPGAIAPPPAGEPTVQRYRTAPVTREDNVVDIPTDFGCLVESSAQNGRLCSQVSFYDSGDPATNRLDLYLCNSTTTDKRLDFGRQNEVDFSVLRGNEVVWRWSADHPPTADLHEVVISTGTCSVWTTAYSKVDQQGQALPKGAYTLRGTIDSPDAGLAATAVGQFTIR